MRLRAIITIVFCVSAVAPLVIFWLWPLSKAIDHEIKSANEQHLAIARNISLSLDRYHETLSGTLMHVARGNTSGENAASYSSLLENLDVNFFCTIDPGSGKIGRSISTSTGECPSAFDGEEFKWVQEQVSQTQNTLVLSGVMDSAINGNVLLAMIRDGDQISIASINTNTLISIGKSVDFGNGVYAKIVDQFGRVLWHPNEEWQKNRTDISNIGLVQEMKNKSSGTGSFYSAFMNEKMVAGYARSGISGWGVVVPQPLSELKHRASELKNVALMVMIIGLCIAIALAYFASKILTHPIEQMVISMRRIGNGELRAHEKMSEGKLQPKEFSEARESIRSMAEKLQENIDTISRHAYLDGVTGLPNRECFRVLAQEEIDKLALSGNQGALLFLDLDGFKQVNDVYGHRAGDDLLLAFSQRLHEYCGVFMKRYARGVDNALTILPARLGGDEFVVFLGNISGPETTAEFANQLFSRVFGRFELHNNLVLDISGSVGGAIFPTQAGDFDELLRLADIAMYEAKNNGKGRYCLHRDVNDYFEEVSEADHFQTV